MSELARKRRSTAVAKLRANALANILVDIAEEDAQICRAMNRAARLASPEAGEALMALPIDELKKLGWSSREDLQVAIDAKRSSKYAPVYLRLANDRAMVRWRDGQGEKPAQKAVAFIVPVPQPARPAEPTKIVIDVQAEETKK